MHLGKRHNVTPDIPSSDRLKTILNSILSSVSDTLKAPVCMTEVELNFRSSLLRTDEVVPLDCVAAQPLLILVTRRQQQTGLLIS